MIFVDASALVAVLTDEPGSRSLLDALDEADGAVTSAIAIYEAALGLRRKRFCSVAEAESDVRDFLAAARIGVAAIEPAVASGALDAFARYGKGTGHPAQLNMGDCFAYAQAKALNARLLYKGEDFALTDIAAAE
jgi:ribonuclease VapC